MDDDLLPKLDSTWAELPGAEKLAIAPGAAHPPRILLLYGSNRERSLSRVGRLTFRIARHA